MRPTSIIDWLAIIAIIEAAHLVLLVLLTIAVVHLFTTHDNSVLRKLDELFGQRPLQLGDNATSTMDVAHNLRMRLHYWLTGRSSNTEH